MSFVRIPRRSGSSSSLDSSRAKKKRKPKAVWDDSVTDLTQHKATREEIERRRSVHKSQNLDTVRQEKLHKQIAKAKANEESLKDTSSYNGTRLLREILYDQSQLDDALSHSDRVMSVVQDLFGDDPKRKAAFPNVTLAPGQKAGHRPQGPISAAPETPSRLTILSESVMDPHALNDMGDNESSESDSGEDKENLPQIYHGNLNFDRFQDFIRKQVNQPYDSTHASLLQDMGNRKSNQERVQPTKELQADSLNSTHEGDGDTTPVAMTMAINDTAKVKNKHRSRIEKDKHQKKQEDKKSDTLNLSTVLRGLEQQMTDYEVSTGRQPNSNSAVNTSQLISGNTAGVSGYTTLLVQTIAKLIGYLKETEARWLEEKQVREQMQYQIAEQRILLDAITADLYATQDLQLQNHQESNQYMAHTQAQLCSIQEMLSGLGLQAATTTKHIPHVSDHQALPLKDMTQQSIAPQSRLPQPGSNEPHQLEQQVPHQQHQPGQSGSHQPLQKGSHQPLQPGSHQPGSHQLLQPGSHQPLQKGSHQPLQPGSHQQIHQKHSQPVPYQQHQPRQSGSHQPLQPRPHQPLHQEHSQPVQSRLSSSQPIPLPYRQPQPTMQSRPVQPKVWSTEAQPIQTGHFSNKHPQTHLEGATNTMERLPVNAIGLGMHSQEGPSSPRTLADEFSKALLQATSKTESVSQLDSQTVADTNHGHIHSIPNMAGSGRLSHTHQARDSNFIQSNVAQLTSSFLEDKRHLGTRDTHIPFQPAILLSPPRQRDRSTVVRPKVTSVGAYPMSSADGTVMGTIHSMQRGAHPVAQSIYGNFAAHETDSDLAARIAQLTKQHEEAQSRLSQLESGGHENANRREGSEGSTTVEQSNTDRSRVDTRSSQPVPVYSSRLSKGSVHPVSPPISPIPYEHPQMKQVKKGPSHLAKGGRTIHVSLPRPDDLEISATSTPSPKTAENRTRARLSNASQGSQQWKTPERNDGSHEDQFFALTAHMST